MVPMIKRQIETLKAPAGEKHGARRGGEEDSANGGNDEGEVAKRLDRVEHLLQEMADRLKTIETRLPASKQ
jgi:hypothetical protein